LAYDFFGLGLAYRLKKRLGGLQTGLGGAEKGSKKG